MTEPEILLLDEPTANLDPQSRRQIFDLILRLGERTGDHHCPGWEHNIGEILEEVDHILALDGHGNVVARGSREAVLAQGWRLRQEKDTVGAAKDLSTEEEVLRITDLEFAYPIPGRRKKDPANGKKILTD